MSTLTSVMKSRVQHMLRARGVAVTRTSRFDRLLDNERREHYLNVIASVGPQHCFDLVQAALHARSQFGQDLFVLSQTSMKQGGYFVEFGATNGLDLSNTHLLEKKFGWTGILAEPARIWREQLQRNRSCQIETKCVWSATGETLRFNEVDAAEFSTIRDFNASDGYKAVRDAGAEYDVETISLADMLDSYGAPGTIDYLSIDTEGSEFAILERFPFDRYQFRVISCEHNFTPMRDRLHVLLTSHGYVRKHTEISQVDDWYVLT